MSTQIKTSARVGCGRLVRRFAFRKHTNPRVAKILPDEIEVGWHFTDETGATHFVEWGCTRNRESLQRLIADVMNKHGKMEVVDLDAPNKHI